MVLQEARTFFYGNYEGQRRRQGNILQGRVPTQQQLAGDLSALLPGRVIIDPRNNNLPFPGNRIPTERINPLIRQLIQYFPAANLPPGFRPGVNFLITPSNTDRRNQFTGRIDHKLSDKGNVFGRYTYANNLLGDAFYRPGAGLHRPDRTWFLALGYTYLFSPNLISESRLGGTYAYLAREQDGERFSTNYAAQLGIKNLVPSPGEYVLPNLRLTDYSPGVPGGTSGLGGFVGYGLNIVQNNFYYTGSETLTWIRRNHSTKFGFDVRRLQVGYDRGSNQGGIFNFTGNYTGDAVGDMLLGFPQSASGGLGSLGNYGGVSKYSHATQYQGFVQDDWKITPRVTLNIGLRYEFFHQYRGSRDRLAAFDLASGRQLLANSADYYLPGVGLIQGSGAKLLPSRPIRSDPNNFAPRFGLAYRLGNKTAIRSGLGLFYSPDPTGGLLGPMTSTAPFYVIANPISSSRTPELNISDLFSPASTTPAAVNSTVDRGRRIGYAVQYNLTIQHQLTPSLLFETGYIGNQAQKQAGGLLVNQPRLDTDPLRPTPITSRMPYPALAPGFSLNTNYQFSNYNAGYFKFEKRLSGNLGYTASYTWSKLIDGGGAGQNMYDRRPERGLGDNDVRHHLVLSYIYALPLGRGKRFNISNAALDVLLGGWQANGITNFQSGSPFSIASANDIANVSTGGQRADVVGAASRLDPRTNGLLGFATGAYRVPARGAFGNAARNTQQGFGINNWDFSLYKSVPIRRLGESGRLQIRAELFNVWNHTQFRNPAATVNAFGFGLVNSTFDPRIMQLAGKLFF